MQFFLRGCAVAAFLGIFASALPAEQPFPWEPTLENAQRQAASTQRLILVHFWAPQCVPCQRMESEVFSQPSVAAQLVGNFVPVKINADQYPDIARQYGVGRLPTDVILTPQGQVVQSYFGRTDAASYVARLNQTLAAYRQPGGTLAQIPSGKPSGPGNLPPVAAEAAPPSLPVATSVSAERFPDYSRNAALIPPQPTASAATASPAIPSLPTAAIAAPGPSAPAVAAPGPSLVAPAPAYGQPAGNDAGRGAPAELGPALNVAGPNALGQNAALPPTNPTPSMPPVNAPTNSALQPSSPSAPGPASPGSGFQVYPSGLDEYCPVTLVEKQRWIKGDKRYGVNHLGRTYLFAGPEEQRRFYDNPDRYAPMNSGYDVVMAIEQGKSVPGLREHGVFYAEHIFLFGDEASLERFARNPAYYANQALEALRASSPANPPVR
jgi:thiol-disulfide isomerase/thioredoxin/YHS domain-containing protein